MFIPKDGGGCVQLFIFSQEQATAIRRGLLQKKGKVLITPLKKKNFFLFDVKMFFIKMNQNSL